MTAPSSTAGWYPDPWRVAPWRWWDGVGWTAHVHTGAADHKPKLPSWLSVPVIVGGVISGLVTLVLALSAPIAIVLGLVPLVIVIPVLRWLDRVEPEPRDARVHSLLWGATVAVAAAIIINSTVEAMAGSTVAAVVSAPIVEEAAKAAGILWAVRRKELDGVMDGVVYAGWVALGFAVVEDFLYFAEAGEAVFTVFIVRALLTPFAHPLFTAWTGMAIGLAVARRKPLVPYTIAGYLVAVVLHAAWNGALSTADDDSLGIVGIAAGLFVLLFLAVGLALVRLRKGDKRAFERLVPMMAQRYGLSPAEVATFASWNQLRTTRKGLTKQHRKRFDAMHASLARLAHLHDNATKLGSIDPVAEARLVEQLRSASTKDAR